MTRRVLWLIKGLGAGGAEQLLVEAAAAGDRSRFEYEVAYLVPWKDALVADLAALDVPVRCLGLRGDWDLRWALRLRRLLRTRRYDVVHLHSPYVAGIARLIVRSLPKSRRPRLVTTEHNAWSTYAWPTRLLNGVTAPLDDATIVVSPHVAASMWPHVRKRAESLIHGIALADVRAAAGTPAAARAELGVAPDTFLVGTVANYREQKDYPTLLGAARIIDDMNLPIRFCAIGQGPLEAEIAEQRHRLGLEHRVLLPGYRDDAVALMAGFDAFVLASRFEGLPVALMEALALGLPVVATAVGGVPEVVTDGREGVLVPPARPDLLAAAIVELAADPGRRTAMAAAAASRGDDFDIRRAVRRIEAIYAEVAPT